MCSQFIRANYKDREKKTYPKCDTRQSWQLFGSSTIFDGGVEMEDLAERNYCYFRP